MWHAWRKEDIHTILVRKTEREHFDERDTDGE
jgi:hypothetical protein